MRHDEIRTFRDGDYADRVANDAASVLKYVTPGMTYTMAASLEDAPADATGRGPASITDIVHAMVSAWKSRSVSIRMMLIDTDCAAVYSAFACNTRRPAKPLTWMSAISGRSAIARASALSNSPTQS